MKSLYIICIISSLLLLTSQSATSEQVYRWVDEKGKVHFGDKPPITNAEQLNIKPSKGIGKMDTPPSGQDFREVQQKMVDSYDERQKLEEKKAAKQKLEEQQRLKECAKAKKEYKTLEAPRVYVLDKKGEQVYLSEEEIEAGKKKTREWIDKNCPQ